MDGVDGVVIKNDEENYFTIAYILMTIAIICQVIYYSFVVYSYQNIRRTLIDKGRLLQLTPIINIATVCVQPNQAQCVNPSCSGYSQAPPYPGTTGVILNKVPPPPYVP